MSILFYAWGEKILTLVMLASVAANWIFGLLLERYPAGHGGKFVVAGAVVVNLGLLGFFKYSGFFVEQLNDVIVPLGFSAWVFDAPPLPLGISFFTFHALSYVIDIYRREAPAQRNPVDFALYISLFPQLIAGPIIRYHDISTQLTQRRTRFDYVVSGVERFVAGFGKKMLLANPLGEVADTIFALPPDQLTTPVAWLGIICYALQIYLDFSAYSDMAIGLARLFGFDFLENFNYPYKARSVQEFWRRWHISLSNWFRDYFYIPLGGSRVVEWRVWFNLVIVFLACGLWHGASWTFVVWGALHGLFLVLERIGLGRVLARLPAFIRSAYLLLVVTVAWVFFRADDIGAAFTYLGAMAGLNTPAQGPGVEDYLDIAVVIYLALGIMASAGLFTRLTADWRCRAGQVHGILSPGLDTLRIGADGRAMLAGRFVLLCAIAWLAAAQMAGGTYNPFIYFRF
ncbi:MBOAT family O-acyltransferase [Pseudochelatococcus contaminans]|uniref:Probable alginate O-acetylase AlgI n=1 Tax=Pseudochelatococcus contaminans TaxID=1538103 RepID=A0A7W5Z360_9HYPH|nr:MBOAT family O-acyltransferase [Pseudochelatococcus contaminans]MBB3808980.1 alginate O-acetyltransferase complex protein AlgI [Pseudochelatococcus contaminans]